MLVWSASKIAFHTAMPQLGCGFITQQGEIEKNIVDMDSQIDPTLNGYQEKSSQES